MKTCISVLAMIIAASPALAHEGAHLHPHGAGSWLNAVLLLSLVGVGAITLWVRGRK